MCRHLSSRIVAGVMFVAFLWPVAGRAAQPDSLGSSVRLARSSPDWIQMGDQAGAEFGLNVAPAGDVNGDGYPDVIIGARYYDTPLVDAGRAYLFLGSPSGLSATAAWTMRGDQAGGEFGYPVASAGDVNGDGYDDVIIGARNYDTSRVDAGRAYLFLGSPSGLSATPAWMVEGDQTGESLGHPVDGAGDVNGDGYDDILVGAYRYDGGQADMGQVRVYLGSPTGPSSTPSWVVTGDQAGAFFGTSAARAGDVNGDGFADIIVSAYKYDHKYPDEGRAYVYLGSVDGLSTSPAWIGDGGQAACKYGAMVSSAGDVNQDGYADVIVGAPDYTRSDTHEGAAFVYLGSSAGLSPVPDWTAYGGGPSVFFGRSVGGVGDTNGDGYDDVILGASGAEAVLVYRGSPNGLSTIPAEVEYAPQGGSLYGYSAAGAGDVNRDGFADILVGAPWQDGEQPHEGAAFLYLGAPSVPSGHPVWSAQGDQAGAEFGLNVAPAGDVNGDGYPDVIIGARYYDTPLVDAGRAYLFLGSPSGLSATAAWTMRGDQAGGEFGYPVASAGDVNGDGYDDVIIGARNYDTSRVDAGRAYLFLGSPSGLSATPAWMVEGDQTGESLGHPVDGAGDINGDGYDDVLVGAYRYDGGQADMGQVRVYLGSPTGPSSAPSWVVTGDQAGALFGTSAARAGDVNGDGFADIIVSAYKYDHKYPDEGRAYVYLGSVDGLSTSPAWIGDGGQAACKYGAMVSSAGDVNQDGYADVIVGAPDYTRSFGHEGAAFVYLGSSAGLSPVPDWTAYGEGTSVFFGRSVGGAGDTNGDGYDDIIVGASGFEDGQSDEGAAYVYRGSGAFGLSASPSWVAQSNQSGAGFGYSAAGAGDVNRDGYGDFLVGSPWYDDPENNEGKAFLYRGGPLAPTPVEPIGGNAAMQALRFVSIWPNPCAPGAGAGSVLSITYSMPRSEWVRLSAYDPTGRRVARLVDAVRSAGNQTARWDGRLDPGGRAASGVYFLRLESLGQKRTARVILAR